jgi:hypothetical protein
MEVAPYVRVSTTRPQHTQTIEQQWPVFATMWRPSPIVMWPKSISTAMTALVGASSTVPVWIGYRERAALAAFEFVLMTAPDRLARTMSTKGSSAANLSSEAVRSSFWRGR